MAKRARKVLIVGTSLALFCSVWPTAIAQRDVTGPTVLKFSNVRYSPSQDALVGANIRLVRENGTLMGTFTVYDGSHAGRAYPLRGTLQDGRVGFTVRAGTKTLRFQGIINGSTLEGTLTTTAPGGNKDVSEFKARRVRGS